MKQYQKGFTIVELLIVVVVIAILASITIVSYSGITAQAHDAKMGSYADSIQKAVRINQIKTGTFGTAGETSSRTQALQHYGLNSLTNDVFICASGSNGHDAGCDASTPDKGKVFMYIGDTQVWWNVWSNKDTTWVKYELRDSFGDELQVEQNSSPVWPG